MLGFHEKPLERSEECATHGPYVAKCYMRDIWVGCPACARQSEEARLEAERIAEGKRKAAAWAKVMGCAGIPERFQNRTLGNYIPENPQQERMLAVCRDFAGDFELVRRTGRSMLLLGLPGTGKTHLSVGIALQIMECGRTAVFTTASRIFRSIRDTYGKKSERTEGEAMAAYTQCDLLIIDEVGVQRGSDFERDALFDVINERYENLRPTIILSNLTLEECKKYLGERVFDRLRENGGKAFVFDWESYRGKAA